MNLIHPLPDWVAAAKCGGMPTAVFYPPGNDEKEWSDERDLERYAEAKAVCAECDVRPQCLEHALRWREKYGCWGGRTPKERREMLGRRRNAS